jgi:hypothetical protein
LSFQVLPRTIATLAQTNWSIKDVQGILGHTKEDTTAKVYIQVIEASVRETQKAIYAELKAPAKLAAVS